MEDKQSTQILAENIIRLRTKNNLSQAELAKASGKELKEIQILESGGGKDTTILDLMRLAKGMNISTELLFKGL